MFIVEMSEPVTETEETLPTEEEKAEEDLIPEVVIGDINDSIAYSTVNDLVLLKRVRRFVFADIHKSLSNNTNRPSQTQNMYQPIIIFILNIGHQIF